MVVGAAVALAVSAAPGHAFDPRNPQVVFNSASLAAYFASVNQTFNVTTDQLDGQVWSSNVSGNAEFTIMLELAGNAPVNGIGIYNTLDPPNPPLFQVFPGAAGPGWFATAHFASGNLTVTLFDNNSAFLGQTFYAGVDAAHFGFYVQGPGGTFYSQDARNPGGLPQMLTYAGTGTEYGDWWMAMEDLAFVTGDADFDDAVLLLQSVVPTAARPHTLGSIKARYR